MSSSFTDPNDSQNELENSFVTSYMMEVEDDAPLTAETQSDEEQAITQPYQNEPNTDAEWVANYYEKRQEQEDRLEMFRGRFEGHATVESW